MTQDQKISNPINFWIPIGVAVGVSIGAGMHHVWLGSGLGAAIGGAIGIIRRMKTKNDSGNGVNP